jgi:hypothetical protein
MLPSDLNVAPLGEHHTPSSSVSPMVQHGGALSSTSSLVTTGQPVSPVCEQDSVRRRTQGSDEWNQSS